MGYGAKIVDGFDVEDIKSFQNFVQVFGRGGRMYTAKSVVLCPGPWAGDLLARVGVRLPLQPIKIPVYYWKTRNWSERSACAALGCWHKQRWPLF